MGGPFRTHPPLKTDLKNNSSYKNCSHFWDICQKCTKMSKHIFKICSYIQKMTTNPINALIITIYNTKLMKIHKYIKQNHVFEKFYIYYSVIYQNSIIHILYFLYMLYMVYFVYWVRRSITRFLFPKKTAATLTVTSLIIAVGMKERFAGMTSPAT